MNVSYRKFTNWDNSPRLDNRYIPFAATIMQRVFNVYDCDDYVYICCVGVHSTGMPPETYPKVKLPMYVRLSNGANQNINQRFVCGFFDLKDDSYNIISMLTPDMLRKNDLITLVQKHLELDVDRKYGEIL